MQGLDIRVELRDHQIEGQEIFQMVLPFNTCQEVRVVGDLKAYIFFKREQDGFEREHYVTLYKERPYVLLQSDGSASKKDFSQVPENCFEEVSQSLQAQETEDTFSQEELSEDRKKIIERIRERMREKNIPESYIDAFVKELSENLPEDFKVEDLPEEITIVLSDGEDGRKEVVVELQDKESPEEVKEEDIYYFYNDYSKGFLDGFRDDLIVRVKKFKDSEEIKEYPLHYGGCIKLELLDESEVFAFWNDNEKYEHVSMDKNNPFLVFAWKPEQGYFTVLARLLTFQYDKLPTLKFFKRPFSEIPRSCF